MKRRWMATAWLALGCLVPAFAGGADKPDSRGGLGLAVRRQVPRRLDLGAAGQAGDEVGGQGRRDRRLGRPVDALQPPGRLQELQVPRRGEDQRQGELRHVRPDPQGSRRSRTATRSRSTPPTATRSRPARSTPWSTSRRPSSRPTPGSPRRSRCVDVNYRGKMVTKFRISVNGELLFEYLDHDRLWKDGPLRLPAARPRQQGLDPQGRGHGTAADQGARSPSRPEAS